MRHQRDCISVQNIWVHNICSQNIGVLNKASQKASISFSNSWRINGVFLIKNQGKNHVFPSKKAEIYKEMYNTYWTAEENKKAR